ncbi:MAG TPA: aldehyde dehydrogenase family protein, partial [Ignavibacteria bacterium]|nr:aldehyde dehydrogenase family protein [Ignavibacteria bacterium]
MTFREKSAPAAGRSSANSESRSNGSAKKSVWEYAPSAESTDHILLKDKYDLFINGKWVKTRKYFATINPATEEKIAEAAWASKDDVNRAVLAAEKAYNNVWSKTSPKERAKYIFR